MFGQNKPTFGSTGNTFGATTGGSLFGQQSKPAGSVFGTTNTNQQQSSLFGQKPTSLFGSPSTAQNSSIFGANANTAQGSGLFGQSKPSLFGQTTTNQGATFGAPSATGGGLFGNTAGATASGSIFGASSAAAPNGTTVKFNPLIGTDTMMKNGSSQSIQTKNFCITAMKEYEAKSYEELRIEDYMANRKAPAAGTTSGGLFGSANAPQSNSLFGNTATPPTKSLFGAAATSSPFGGASTSGGLFGQQQQQTQQQGSLFGNKPTTSVFGATSVAPATFGAATNTASGSLFGNSNNATASAFGQQPQPAGSLFGGGAATNTFGQQNTGGGLFGQATTSTFGQPATSTTGGLFGSNTAANTSGGLFGKPAAATTGGFGFGAPAANTSFGQPAAGTGTGLFGNTAAKPGGLFGNTGTAPAATGLFGAQSNQQNSGGLFGSQPTQNSGLFGNVGQQPVAMVATNPTSVTMPAPVVILGSDANESRAKLALMEAQLAASPYGETPLLKLSSRNDTDDSPNPTSATRQMRFLASRTSALSSNGSVSNGPLNTSMNGNGSLLKSSFLSNHSPAAGATIRSPAVTVDRDLNYKSSIKPPTLGSGIRGPQYTSNKSLNKTHFDRTVDSAISNGLSTSQNSLSLSTRKSNLKYLDINAVNEALDAHTSRREDSDADALPRTVELATSEINSPAVNPVSAAQQRVDEVRRTEIPVLNLDTTESHMEAEVIPVSPPTQERTAGGLNTTQSPGGVTLNNIEYYCEPSIREMAEMIVGDKVVLHNGLTIGRATYGSVYWPGRIELKNVGLDEIVIFRHKEVTVYPDDSKKANLGEELNRPAEVTLERVWYVDKQTKEEIKDPLILAEIGWRNRLQSVTAKMGATFKDYRLDSGSWVFRVEHFSKYGLPDEEDENVAPADRNVHQRKLHNHVQRQKLNISTPEIMEDDEASSDGSDSGSGGLFTANVSRGKKLTGLGGDITSRDHHLLKSNYPWSYEDSIAEVPPEKKLKMDDSESILEDSKRLMESLAPISLKHAEKPTPTCFNGVRSFTGGFEAATNVGTDKSRLIDAACVHGHSCSITWSADGRHCQSLQPLSNAVYLRDLNYSSDVTQEYLTDLFEHNMRQSQLIKRNNSISAKVRHCEVEGQPVSPRVKPTDDHAQLIDSFLATAKQSARTTDARVWSLCKSLFPGNRTDRWEWSRTDAVCDWLREEVNKEKCPSFTGRGGATWAAIIRGDLEKAIEKASEEGLYKVAMLLSSYSIDPESTRDEFAQQIRSWEISEALLTIDIHVLKIYMVLAGMKSLSRSRGGLKEIVNTLDGLSWRQSLGVYLWWLRGNGRIEDVIQLVKTISAPEFPEDVLTQQLITLACSNHHSVEAVLDSANKLTESPLDMHLCWHLWSVLRSVGYNTMTPESEQRMHMSYAEQLTALTLPEFAAFVLSHISSDQCRVTAIRNFLDKIVYTTSAGDLEKIGRSNEMPSQWIANAKFLRNKVLGRDVPIQQCQLALKAASYVTAQQIFCEDVAPNALLCEDMDTLRSLTIQFDAVSHLIPGWGPNGQLYVDYVRFKSLTGDEEVDEVEEIISSLEVRLRAPVFSKPVQKLCVQSISVEVFEARRVLGSVKFDLPLTDKQIEKLCARLIKY